MIDCKVNRDNWTEAFLEKYDSLLDDGGYDSQVLKNNLLNLKNSPQENITNIIVERRLKNFGHQLSRFGLQHASNYSYLNFTLPAYNNMHLLSKDFKDNGINAFVKQHRDQKNSF